MVILMNFPGRQTTKESICSSSTTIHNHHVSYESLDTFPISGYQLETLKISDNSYYPNHLSGRGDGGNLAPESSKHFSNCEKQRHLSDWYYIKSSPKARQQWTEGSNTGEDYLKRFPQKSASATQFPGVVAGTETGLHSIICDNRILRDHRRYVPLAPAELNSSTSLHVQYENVDQLICEKRDIAIDLTPLNSANGEISQLNNNRDFFCNATFIQSENNLKDFHFYENLVEQKNKNTPASLLLPQSPVSISTIESNHHYTQQSNKVSECQSLWTPFFCLQCSDCMYILGKKIREILREFSFLIALLFLSPFRSWLVELYFNISLKVHKNRGRNNL